MYYDENAAIAAEAEFDRIFIKKELPEDIPVYKLKDRNQELPLIDLIMMVGLLLHGRKQEDLFHRGEFILTEKRSKIFPPS